MKLTNDKISTLVIVLSETRAYEHTFNFFKSNLLDVLHADLCLCVANNHREVKDNPFYKEAKYIWTYDEPDDWGDAYDQAQNKLGCHKNWRQLLSIKDQWLGGIKGDGQHPGSAGILLFFRWFLKSSILSAGVNEKYDWFVVTRSDFIHRTPHVPLNLLSPEYIWIPDGEDYGGYTDRHIVVSKNDILAVLSISDRIIEDPDQLLSDMSCHSEWNLEKYIKFAFSYLGLAERVRRFPYTMYTVRSETGHTRWSEGAFSPQFGYFIKYPNEYKSYRFFSLFIKKPVDWSANKIKLLSALWNLIIYSRYFTNVFKSYNKEFKKITKKFIRRYISFSIRAHEHDKSEIQ